MYDWPEVRTETDAFWQVLRGALRQRGFDAPTSLDRAIDRAEAWRSDRLLIGQTCGLPFVTGVCGDALILGAFDHDVAGCEAGDYCSYVIARPGTGGSIHDYEGSQVAFNARDSQSGHAALVSLVAPLAGPGRFFSSVVETGTHRASIVAVATGAADIAAVDAVSWSLAMQHESAADDVVVIDRTACTPALPLITSRVNAENRDQINLAVRDAVGSMDASILQALNIAGYCERTDAQYSVIAERLDRAVSVGYPELA